MAIMISQKPTLTQVFVEWTQLDAIEGYHDFAKPMSIQIFEKWTQPKAIGGYHDLQKPMLAQAFYKMDVTKSCQWLP